MDILCINNTSKVYSKTLRSLAIIFCFFLFACTNKTRTSSNSGFSSKDISRAFRASSSYSYNNALEIVRSFSKSFEPDSSAYKGIGTLKNIPDSIIRSFRTLRYSDTLSHKKYLTIILLKLYLDHLRCCHQSYEIRENPSGPIDSAADPLLYEFNLATKMFNINEYHEFISSGIADTYVESHQELLKYPEIKEVMEKIKPVSDSIDKGLYWLN